VVNDLKGSCIILMVKLVVAADIFIAKMLTFSVLSMKIEPFSSYAAQHLLLLWLDRNILLSSNIT
jgi:hypothetical protein